MKKKSILIAIISLMYSNYGVADSSVLFNIGFAAELGFGKAAVSQAAVVIETLPKTDTIIIEPEPVVNVEYKTVHVVERPNVIYVEPPPKVIFYPSRYHTPSGRYVPEYRNRHHWQYRPMPYSKVKRVGPPPPNVWTPSNKIKGRKPGNGLRKR